MSSPPLIHCVENYAWGKVYIFDFKVQILYVFTSEMGLTWVFTWMCLKIVPLPSCLALRIRRIFKLVRLRHRIRSCPKSFHVFVSESNGPQITILYFFPSFFFSFWKKTHFRPLMLSKSQATHLDPMRIGVSNWEKLQRIFSGFNMRLLNSGSLTLSSFSL